MLTCSLCDIWMYKDKIKMCACKIICDNCASPLTKCEDCHFKFNHDMRLVNFHQRIAEQISRPCKFVREGCAHVVKPGEQHEVNCKYEPTACRRCKLLVSKIRLEEHFVESHFLGADNADVKLEDFYLEATGSRKIKCVTSHGLSVYITLSLDSAGKFCRFTMIYPAITDVNFKVKLMFNMDGYLYTRTNFKKNNGKTFNSYINIDKKKYQDWINRKSTLCIKVSERKKPQKSIKSLFI